jgi:hypothetical protein
MKRSGPLFILAFSPKAGLCDHHAVCVSHLINFWIPEPVFHKSLLSLCVYVCVSLLPFARQRLGKQVPATKNTRNNRRIVGLVCLCISLSLLGINSVKAFPLQRRIFGGFVLRDTCCLNLPRTSWVSIPQFSKKDWGKWRLRKHLWISPINLSHDVCSRCDSVKWLTTNYRIGDRVLSGAETFSFLKMVQTGSGAHLSPYTVGAKRLKLEPN